MLTVTVTRTPPTKSFASVEQRATLFEFKGDICMSLGWPSGRNDVGYVIIHSEDPDKIGNQGSQHNGTPGVTLLEGKLEVWPKE